MIQLENCTKEFDKILLDHLNLTINPGEITAIIGPSGCGKTTLLNLIMGLDKDYSGTIHIDRDKRFSVVFQEDRLLENKTLAENLSAVCTHLERNKEIAGLLKLSDAFYQPVRDMSGGMKRRAALARALVFDGDIFILDEPLKGIDLGLKREIIETLRSLLIDKTCVFVSHSVSEVMAIAHRIIIINDGKIVKDIQRSAIDSEETLRGYILSDGEEAEKE